jgi:hypothetical protein
MFYEILNSRICRQRAAYFAHEKLEIVLSAPVPAYWSSRRGGQKGGVDIRVECVTPDGFSGKKRDLVSWY